MQIFEVDNQLPLVNVPHLFSVDCVKDILNRNGWFCSNDGMDNIITLRSSFWPISTSFKRFPKKKEVVLPLLVDEDEVSDRAFYSQHKSSLLLLFPKLSNRKTRGLLSLLLNSRFQEIYQM